MSPTAITVKGAATIHRLADHGSTVLEFWLPAEKREEAAVSAKRFVANMGLLPIESRDGPSPLTALFPRGLDKYPIFTVEMVQAKRLVQACVSVEVHFAFAPVMPVAVTAFEEGVTVRCSPVVWTLEGAALVQAHADARTAAVSDAQGRARDFADALGCRSHQMTAVREISLLDMNVTDPDWVVGEFGAVAERLSAAATFEVTSVIEAVFTGKR